MIERPHSDPHFLIDYFANRNVSVLRCNNFTSREANDIAAFSCNPSADGRDQPLTGVIIRES
jgi:hypothetical protein